MGRMFAVNWTVPWFVSSDPSNVCVLADGVPVRVIVMPTEVPADTAVGLMPPAVA